jgi:hypothetical protein
MVSPARIRHSSACRIAQAVNLTCVGELHIYEPERMDANVDPTASAVDLASKEITTPLGTFRLSRIEENKLTFDGPATREFNLVTDGSLDRLTGKMVIMWLRPEQDAKYKIGQLETMARHAVLDREAPVLKLGPAPRCPTGSVLD